MIIKKVPLCSVSTADILHFARCGDKIESSRAHVGPTTASLPHFHVSAGTHIQSQLVDTTFGDYGFNPHCSISNEGTIVIGDPTVITYMMKAHTKDERNGLQVGDFVSNWHISRLSGLFPNLNLVTSSSIYKENAELLKVVLESSWELLHQHDIHSFRHYVESDGVVISGEKPASLSVVLEDLAMVTGDSGWRVPNIVTIVLDILLGSKHGTSYYHLCGPAMWKYIDEYDYQPLIEAIFLKMKRFGREMNLINAGSFRVFALIEDKNLLDEVWMLWKKLKQETTAKRQSALQSELIAKIRSKKLPWFDKCEGEQEIAQNELKSADDIYVPQWAIHANFEELSEFVAYTVKIWRSRKK